MYNKQERASYIPPGIIGISHDYPELAKWLDDNLIPSMAAEFRKAESQCFDGNDMYKYQDLGKYFKRGYNSLFDPIPNRIIQRAGVCSLTSTVRYCSLRQGLWGSMTHQRFPGISMR